MANRNGARFLAAAAGSVLAQTMADLELVIADDASGDESRDIAAGLARRDPRVRLLPLAAAGGAGAARNAAIAAASGDWLAVMDSDDLMHPERLERLLAAAQDLGADAVADDLIHFGEDPAAAGRTLLQGLAATAPFVLDAAMLLACEGADPSLPAFGYLKPLIRRAALGALRYDTALRIGEDFDLYLRLVAAGARFVVVPEPLYLYRRHTASLSHRQSVAGVTAILAAHDRFAAAQPNGGALGPLLAARRRNLERMLRFETLVARIRAGQVAAAAGALVRSPRLLAGLARSAADRVRRRAAPPRAGELRLVLTAAGGGAGAAVPPPGPGQLALVVPGRPPRVGFPSEPLAPLASRLSALAARHVLHVTGATPETAYVAAMVPPAAGDAPAA